MATKKARIKTLGQMLTRINNELQNRDMTSVPTDKLMDIAIKLSNLLDKESDEVNFTGKTDSINKMAMFEETETWVG